jgi:hypothetical protein
MASSSSSFQAESELARVCEQNFIDTSSAKPSALYELVLMELKRLLPDGASVSECCTQLVLTVTDGRNLPEELEFGRGVGTEDVTKARAAITANRSVRIARFARDWQVLPALSAGFVAGTTQRCIGTCNRPAGPCRGSSTRGG